MASGTEVKLTLGWYETIHVLYSFFKRQKGVVGTLPTDCRIDESGARLDGIDATARRVGGEELAVGAHALLEILQRPFCFCSSENLFRYFVSCILCLVSCGICFISRN